MTSKNYSSFHDLKFFHRFFLIIFTSFLFLSFSNSVFASSVVSQNVYDGAYSAGTGNRLIQSLGTGLTGNIGSVIYAVSVPTGVNHAFPDLHPVISWYPSSSYCGSSVADCTNDTSTNRIDRVFPASTAFVSDLGADTITGLASHNIFLYQATYSGATFNSGYYYTIMFFENSDGNVLGSFANTFANGIPVAYYGSIGSIGDIAFNIDTSSTPSFSVPETCSDGIQNQNETAIDFGGICPEVETISSDITTSTTWNSGHLYLVSGNIEVATGDILTIEPGTIVKFNTETPSSLTVNGTLVSEGDEGDSDTSLGKIFFTSSKDDSLLGLDTNGDGNATSPTAGDWGGITIGSGGNASFDYAIIRYAGATGTSEAEVYNDGGTVTLEHSGVIHGTTYGIKNTSGTTTISEDSEIGFNDYGLYKNGGTLSVTGSVIHDNSLYGIYNNTASTIDAENNYWGDSTGPYHNSSNLSGLGNAVSNYVDFNPWVDNKHYILNDAEYSEYCGDYNDCTSVYDNELQWKDVDASSYATELSAALSTWGALDNVTMTENNSTPALEFHKVNRDDVAWKGKWDPEQNPDYIYLNSYYLDNNTSSQIQNTITHELGHALGLGHSYTGNIMYFNQTSQTTLGSQDLNDYYYLWP